MIGKKLQLPKSIIILNNDDPIVQEQLVRERQPYLVAGYTLRNYDELPQYSYQATINCDHSQFWLILINIMKLVPEPMSFSIGDYGNLREISGDYDKEKLVSIISGHSEAISEDTEIEMLFDHQGETSAFQLYVSDCKFFELYGYDSKLLIDMMRDCDLPEIVNLATINEFPRTMTGQPNKSTESLLRDIRGSFEKI